MFSVIVLGNVFHEPTVLLAQKNDFSNDTENLGIRDETRTRGGGEKPQRQRRRRDSGSRGVSSLIIPSPPGPAAGGRSSRGL